MQKIMACLWFNGNGEEAAKFYKTVFRGTKIKDVTRYDADTAKVAGRKAGDVLTMTITLLGQEVMILNAGPEFKFSEAVSFIINCRDQKEIDYYWSKLTADGGQESVCGWLKDKFGFSWQVAPAGWEKLYSSKNKKKAAAAMKAMMQMKKLDMKALEKAYREG